MTPQKSRELTKKYMRKVLLQNKTVHPDYVDQQVEADYAAMEKAVDITKYYGNLPEFNKRIFEARSERAKVLSELNTLAKDRTRDLIKRNVEESSKVPTINKECLVYRPNTPVNIFGFKF